LKAQTMRIGMVGLRQSRFGKLSDSSNRELAADAFQAALSDANLARKDVSVLLV